MDTTLQDYPCVTAEAAHAQQMPAKRGKHAELDLFGQRVAAAESSLSPTARRVIRFIDQNRVAVLASSAAELAANIGTSDATVIRAVQALGFEGLGDLRQALVASLDQRSTPADDMRRTLADVGESTDRAIDLVLEIQREALEVLQSGQARTQIAAAVSALHRAERITVFGIGPSAALAHYVSVLLGRTGRSAWTLDATGIALADQLLGLRSGDAMLVLAYTRPYREVAAVFAEARRLGLPIVLITDSLDSKLARFADVIVPARRGRAERVALHSATLVVLEALVLGLAASNRVGAMAALERLNELRESVAGKRVDVG
jgi:DNA-binding MurR/RpiR family transcriptional regulator